MLTLEVTCSLTAASAGGYNLKTDPLIIFKDEIGHFVVQSTLRIERTRAVADIGT